MTKNSGGPTINTGGASRPRAEDRNAEFDVAGNAKRKGEDPSPGDRERGETSSADPGCIDMDAAHDRAS
jgi:hypothetical protein